MRRAAYVMATIGLHAAFAASSAQAAPLDPSGDWQVEATPESCRLGRDFGTGSQRVTFHLFAYGADGSYRVALTGANIPRNDGNAQVTRIGFGPAPMLNEYVAVVSQVGDEGRLSFHLTGWQPAFRYFRGWNVQGSFDDRRPEVPWPADMAKITVENSELGQLVLNLGEMEAPLDLLRQCQYDLSANWGWDRDRLAQIAEPPRLLDAGPTVERMHMPPAMVLNHVTVMVQLRVFVDENGQGSNCVVQSPAFQDRAARDLCRPFISGVQFSPARDTLGNAVAGLFRLSYTYFIFN